MLSIFYLSCPSPGPSHTHESFDVVYLSLLPCLFLSLASILLILLSTFVILLSHTTLMDDYYSTRRNRQALLMNTFVWCRLYQSFVEESCSNHGWVAQKNECSGHSTLHWQGSNSSWTWVSSCYFWWLIVIEYRSVTSLNFLFCISAFS